jgi:diaminohydroxyphosphoribosylaminopyrimidine deaminase/5-amino-6-(5-phosphoribosylamino)uracil reductase
MQTCTKSDLAHLARAIELARNGVGRANPNPVVGAVIALDGAVLGEGWHDELGGPHAEVNAISACGDSDLSAATLYVSLEPCCHHGATPPCTDAILAAGIRRVVVASDDPTEKASGRGLGILRDEGVEIVLAEGELAHATRPSASTRGPVGPGSCSSRP